MAISRSDPYGSGASSGARGGGDRVDRVGDPLGVVLGNEVARTVDTIKRGPKIARQPLAVADLLEAVGGTPHDLGRNIEGRQAIRDGDHHIQNAYEKIGVSTRAAATLFAMQHGLVAWGKLPMVRTARRS